MEKITVVKIGGNVIDDPAALRGFLADFASLPGAKILVHGGGKLATRLAQKLELQVQMVDGRRITDKGTLDIVTMVYAGLVNKQLVAGLHLKLARHGSLTHKTARHTKLRYAGERGQRSILRHTSAGEKIGVSLVVRE